MKRAKQPPSPCSVPNCKAMQAYLMRGRSVMAQMIAETTPRVSSGTDYGIRVRMLASVLIVK